MSRIHAKSGKHQYFGLACHYCGRPATGHDHVIPVAHGGSDLASNLVPACTGCNSRKLNLSIERFRLNEAFRLQRMPIVFKFEDPPDPPRDFLMVGSKSFSQQMIQHNLPRGV
jgi:5-methylcytosine-specific restriction endonuclease McrA